MRAPTLAALTAAGLLGLGGLSACSSDDEGAADDAPSAQEVLAEAKTTLDETSGVQVSLVTEDLPEGVEGLLSAEGVGTPSPAAFDGVITVRFAGFEPEVPVVAVDDVPDVLAHVGHDLGQVARVRQHSIFGREHRVVVLQRGDLQPREGELRGDRRAGRVVLVFLLDLRNNRLHILHI